jgi:hypothetical protein
MSQMRGTVGGHVGASRIGVLDVTNGYFANGWNFNKFLSLLAWYRPLTL